MFDFKLFGTLLCFFLLREVKVTYKTSQSYSHTIEKARNVLTAQKSSIHMVVNFKCVVSYFFAVFSLYHHKRFTDVMLVWPTDCC